MIAIRRQLILIILLTVFSSYMPWWIAVLICVADGYFSTCQKCATLRGTIALGIVWLGMVISRYFDGAEILMERVAEMMGLEYWILGLIIVTLGILIGGLSSFTGSQLRLQFIQEQDQRL